MLLLLVVLAAAANFGDFTIADESVTGREFLSHVGVFIIVAALLLLVIAFAVLTDKPWSRHLMLFFWLIVGAAAIGQAIRGLSEGNGFHIDLTWAVAFALAWWYLFRSRDAALYYQQLRAKASSNLGSEGIHPDVTSQPTSRNTLGS